MLGYLDRLGTTTVAELADRMHVRVQSLTVSMNKLTEAGLIERTTDPDDRRRQLVSLTSDGVNLLTEDRALRDVWLARAVEEQLDETERGLLMLCVPLLERLASTEAIGVPKHMGDPSRRTGGRPGYLPWTDEPVHAAGPRHRRRDGAWRRAGGRPVPGVAERAARLRPPRCRSGREAAPARPDRRAHRRLPRPGSRGGVGSPRAVRHDQRDRCRQRQPRGVRGQLCPCAARRDQRESAYELLGSGANQTIEQFGIFGTQVRAAISLGLAEQDLDTNSQWRSGVCRVLAAARGARTGNAGPVQFDIPLREPLVPEVGVGPDDDLGVFAGRADDAPWTTAAVGKLDVPLDIDLTEDTVVVSGHGAGVRPELAGIPTVAEPTAPAPETPLHPLALSVLRPRQAIICGRPTLHGRCRGFSPTRRYASTR